MQNTTQNKQFPIETPSPWKGLTTGLLLLIAGGVAGFGWMQMVSVQRETSTPVTMPVIQTVTALGRLEPLGAVIQLSAPTSNQGNRVDRLLVQEGDRIKAGQVVAVLDSYGQRKAALEEAEEQVKVAQARLAITQAGAKPGEIEAQRAEIARLEAGQQGDIEAQAARVARLQSELHHAQIEFNRYQALYQEGAISASQRDSQQLALTTAQKSLQEAQAALNRLRTTSPQELNKARATLDQIAQVRLVDVRAAQAEVDQAISARDQAGASLEQSLVRSPIDGEILYIHTRSGEVVSTDGIVEIGQTRQMQAIAEVYQSDISRVRIGQRVYVTSDSISGDLTGTVERIGSQVRRQTVVNTDPSTNIDARVIEVHIKLDANSSQKAAKFTNLQIQVVIQND